MRTLFITKNLYLPYLVGGMEVALDELCIGLKNLGDEPRVLSSRYRRNLRGLTDWLKSLVKLESPFPADRLMSYPVYRGPLSADALEKIKANEWADAVIVHGWRGHRLALASHRLGIPTALHVHDTLFEAQRAVSEFDTSIKFVSASRFVADRLKERFGIASTVILSIIDPERYRVPYQGTKVVFVNPQPMKGVSVALQVARRLPNIPFLFVDAWASKKLKREWREQSKGIRNIEWRRSTLDIRKVYQEAKLLIVPSKFEEGWGRVVSEAQISGIPVVASNRGALPEAVGPGGVVLPHDCVDAWESEIRDLYFNDERRLALSANALAYASRPHIQPDVIIRQYREFIATLRTSR